MGRNRRMRRKTPIFAVALVALVGAGVWASSGIGASGPKDGLAVDPVLGITLPAAKEAVLVQDRNGGPPMSQVKVFAQGATDTTRLVEPAAQSQGILKAPNLQTPLGEEVISPTTGWLYRSPSVSIGVYAGADGRSSDTGAVYELSESFTSGTESTRSATVPSGGALTIVDVQGTGATTTLLLTDEGGASYSFDVASAKLVQTQAPSSP